MDNLTDRQIYTAVAEHLWSIYGQSFFVVRVVMNTERPARGVYITLADDYADMRTFDSDGEFASSIMYEVVVFSGLTNGASTEANGIAEEVNKVFSRLGFQRRSKVPVKTGQSDYEIVLRFVGKISKHNKIGRA